MKPNNPQGLGQHPVRIFYEDTDATGIVYHANYIKFMERGRSLFLLERGIDLNWLRSKAEIQFLVKSIQVEYLQSARLLQEVTVLTHVEEFKKASLRLKQAIYFDPSDPKTMLCRAEVLIVCTRLDGKPCAIPEIIIKGLKSES